MNPILDGEPRNLQEVEKLFKAYDLEQYLDAIGSLIKPKIDLTLFPADESQIDVTASKIGGQAALAQDQDYPTNESGKPLSFIGQINLAEVAKHDQSGLLPTQGMVSFFYCADQEAWGFDPKDKQRFNVMYCDRIDELVKTDFPPDLETEAIFKPNRVQFHASLSLPPGEDDAIDGLIEDDDDIDNYIEISTNSENQIMGYANCIQNPMELQCQLVTNGLYCGNSTGYNDPRRKELEKDKDDWILLLQIDSDTDNTGMMWGDSGRLYFWIKKQDLLSCTFDKAWCILQCY